MGRGPGRGKAKRDPALGDLEVYAGPALAIGDDVEALYGFVKPSLALYIGGMGAKGKNFYHNLATAYGFGKEADTIQELYLSGKKAEATDAVPDELVKNISLIGPKSFVAERVAAFKGGRRDDPQRGPARRRRRWPHQACRGITRTALIRTPFALRSTCVRLLP